MNDKDGSITADMINDLHGKGRAIFQQCNVSKAAGKLDSIEYN